MEKELQKLDERRKGPETLLYNAEKDLHRLRAEKDSLKGEREQVTKEKAALFF